MSEGAARPSATDGRLQEDSKWLIVNTAAAPVNLDFTQCCHPATSALSPIDEFYRSQTSIITVGQPEILAQNEMVGRLMVMGFVACVETYIRDVLSSVAALCPVTKDNISEQQVKFGSLDHYGSEHYVRGLFEGTSFASSSEIKKKSSQFFNLSWNEREELGVAAENFDLVCHVRHAAVHAQGMLNQGNLKALRLNGVAAGQPRRIILDLGIVHECASACRSFIRAYNRKAFETILQTWITRKILVGSEESDLQKYRNLVTTFRSSVDRAQSSPTTDPETELMESYTLLKPQILDRMRK